MKKLVLMLAVVFSVSLFSCGNGNEGAKNDSDTVVAAEVTEEVVEVAVDTVAADSVAADTAVVAE